jgi:hypothetical protein
LEDNDELNWRTSTFSGANGGQCAEVANDGEKIRVRNSKDRAGAVVGFTADEWRAFVAGVRAGEFDLDESGRLP